MPEVPEIETEKLHDAIREELERSGGDLLRRIALTTACLAALAAIAALQAGASANEALALKAEASRLQAEATDQWSHYQAKSVKAAVQEGIRASWAAAGKAAPAGIDDTLRRYAEEERGIAAKAEEKERERITREHEADRLMREHHRYASAVAFFQVAIALGAIAALTRVGLAWIGSLLVGGAGIVAFSIGLLHL